jgi:hypothetical protein
MSNEEGNKLIAEFTGNFYIDAKNLKYHKSWDWLMPAVKKWNDLVIEKRTGGGKGWTKWQYKTAMLRTEIEPVFNDLIKALQWYNTQSATETSANPENKKV